MYVIVASLNDPVSRIFLDVIAPTPLVKTEGNIEIRKFVDFPVVVYRGEPTDFSREDILASFGKYAIFISRHEMANPRPLFTVHTPGSWPDVSISNPPLTSSIFRTLCKLAYEPYTCAFEATHHTPNTSYVSATFVEVGSTENEWKDRKAVETLAQAVEEVLNSQIKPNTPAMAIGDLHYVTVTDPVLKGELDLGHVIPKYVDISLQVVQNAYLKHTTPIERAILFKKNVKNPARSEIIEFLKSRGVEIITKG